MPRISSMMNHKEQSSFESVVNYILHYLCATLQTLHGHTSINKGVETEGDDYHIIVSNVSQGGDGRFYAANFKWQELARFICPDNPESRSKQSEALVVNPVTLWLLTGSFIGVFLASEVSSLRRVCACSLIQGCRHRGLWGLSPPRF